MCTRDDSRLRRLTGSPCAPSIHAHEKQTPQANRERPVERMTPVSPSLESAVSVHNEAGSIRSLPPTRRIWVLSELYYPETTSTGYFLTGTAEGLAPSYKVSIICGQPGYRQRGVQAPAHELLNGVNVHRCWSTTLDKNRLEYRIINLLTISGALFVNALLHVRRGEIVISVTNPPLLP